MGVAFTSTGPDVPFTFTFLLLIRIPFSVRHTAELLTFSMIIFGDLIVSFSFPASITNALSSALMLTFSLPVMFRFFLLALMLRSLVAASRFKSRLALMLIFLFFASMLMSLILV